MFLAVWITHDLPFVFIANASGALMSFLIGIAIVKPWKNRMPYHTREMLRFMMNSLLYFFMLNLFFNVDLWMVRYFLGNEKGGYYVAASMIAKVPYFVFMGLSATVLPMVALGLAKQDLPQVKQTIRHATYFLTVLAIPFAVMIMVCRSGLISLIYTGSYLPAEPILMFLVWGLTGLAFFALFTTILNADNKPLVSSVISAFIIGLDLVLCMIFIPRMGPAGGAISTTLSVWLGTLIVGIFILRRFGSVMRLLSCLRMVLSAIGAGWMCSFFPVDGIHVLWIFPFGLIAYAGFLILSGEIHPKTLGAWMSRYKDFNIMSLLRS